MGALNIVIGGDSSGAIASIRKLRAELQSLKQSGQISLGGMQDALKQFQARLSTATDPKQIAAFKNSIAALKAEIALFQQTGGNALTQFSKGLNNAISPLKTLANILPGVGIAGLFTLAAAGVEKLISSLNSASSATKTLRDSFLEANKETIDSVGTVKALYTVTQDVTQSIKTRRDATKELLSINKENNEKTGEHIKLETDLNGILLENKTAIDEITNSLFKQAYTKAFLGKIGKAFADLVEAETASLNSQTTAVGNFLRRFATARSGLGNISAEGIDIIEKNKSVKKAEEAIKALQDIFAEGLKSGKFSLAGIFDTDKPLGPGKIDFPSQLAVILKQRVTFALAGTAALDLDNVKLVLLDQKKIAKTFKEKFEEVLNKGLSDLVVKPNFKGKFTNEEAFKKLQEDAKKRLQELQVIGAGIADVMRSAFDGLFTSIEKGANAIDGFFKGMVDGIKQVVKQLITAAAIAGILSALGLGSFMTLFKGLVGLPGRASGGPVSGGQPYVVGEQGRELFVPSSSGRIISNNQLNGLNGAAMQMVRVVVEGQISGRNINLVQTRQNRYDKTNV